MTIAEASPATVKDPRALYLEDIFMHARESSRSLRELRQRIEGYLGGLRSVPINLTADQNRELSDLINEYALDTGDLLAAIAPAAVDHVEKLMAVIPGYTQALFDLDGSSALDKLMRPIFEVAGIADDFAPADVRFPGHLGNEEAER